MKLIKLAVISVVVLFIILTAIGSLLPSQILVSRAVDIKGSVVKTKQQVFELKNWQNWMTDAKGGKGDYSFDAKNGTLVMGTTKVSLVHLSDTTIVTNWSASQEMKCTLRVIDHYTPDSLITVQWQMEQKIKWYPWAKFAAITKDELWGASMEKSLDNLKVLAEIQ